MMSPKVRCLVLACGNTVRGDDGAGPWLAQWATERFQHEPSVRILADHQWTPDAAEDLARAESVIFIDCAIDSDPGAVRVLPVAPASSVEALATHHVGAPELLALARDFYGSLPSQALLLTVGAGSTTFSETFSPAVMAALPEACRWLEDTILRLVHHAVRP